MPPKVDKKFEELRSLMEGFTTNMERLTTNVNNMKVELKDEISSVKSKLAEKIDAVKSSHESLSIRVEKNNEMTEKVDTLANDHAAELINVYATTIAISEKMEIYKKTFYDEIVKLRKTITRCLLKTKH